MASWGVVPYSLRHSGPSWDRATWRLTLPEIQRRGRWLSERSVIRYERSARTLALLSGQPPAFLAYLRRCASRLQASVEGTELGSPDLGRARQSPLRPVRRSRESWSQAIELANLGLWRTHGRVCWWKMSGMRKLASASHDRLCQLDQCQYKCAWRRPTTITCGNCQAAPFSSKAVLS